MRQRISGLTGSYDHTSRKLNLSELYIRITSSLHNSIKKKINEKEVGDIFSQ